MTSPSAFHFHHSVLIDSLNSPLRWICRMRAEPQNQSFQTNHRRKVPSPFLSDSLATCSRYVPLRFHGFQFCSRKKLFNLQTGALRRFYGRAVLHLYAEFRSIFEMHESPAVVSHAFRASAFPFCSFFLRTVCLSESSLIYTRPSRASELCMLNTYAYMPSSASAFTGMKSIRILTRVLAIQCATVDA